MDKTSSGARTIIFTRHGETNFRARDLYQGDSTESVLSDLGRRQTRELSEYLRPWKVDQVFASSLPRARETAHLMRFAFPPYAVSTYTAALHEVSVPEWVGLPKAEIPVQDRAKWRSDPHNFQTAKGAFPVRALYERVRPFADELRCLTGTSLIVGHDHVNRAVIASLVGLPIDVHRSLPQGISSLSLVHSERHHDQFLLHASNLQNRDGVALPLYPSQERRIVLVRHGATSGNIARIYQGTASNPLDEVGIEQVSRLEYLLQGVGPSLVLSSDLRRARQTAELLPFPSGVQRRADARLNEFDYGHWVGLEAQEVRRRHPEEYRSWQRADNKNPIRGAESLSSFVSRVRGVLRDVQAAVGAGGTVVVVSHDVVLRVAIGLLLGLAVKDCWNFRLENGAVTELILTEDRYVILRRHNELPGPLEDRHDHEFF
jgi:broad specificity phosphatase PhoE